MQLDEPQEPTVQDEASALTAGSVEAVAATEAQTSVAEGLHNDEHSEKVADAPHVNDAPPLTMDEYMATLADDDIATLQMDGGEILNAPAGALRGNFIFPLPWEPLLQPDGTLVWPRGAVGVPHGMTVTFENIYVVLHRYADGTLIIHRVWGVNMLMTDGGGPYIPGSPLNVAFVPQSGDLVNIHESSMQLPGNVGLKLDTLGGIATRGTKLYEMSKSRIQTQQSNIIQLP